LSAYVWFSRVNAPARPWVVKTNGEELFSAAKVRLHGSVRTHYDESRFELPEAPQAVIECDHVVMEDFEPWPK
jgi:hypothetical protein